LDLPSDLLEAKVPGSSHPPSFASNYHPILPLPKMSDNYLAEKKDFVQDRSTLPQRNPSRDVEDGESVQAVVVDDEGSEVVVEISERAMSWERTAVLL